MLQKGEKDKTVYFRLGRINQYWENLDEAIMFYNKALEIDPDYGEVHYNLGNIYLQDGDLAGSKEHFLKATGENPEDIYAINALAKTYLKLGRFEKTLEQHKKALENNPYDLYALRGTGNVYLVRQNYQEALNYYYKALDINPFDGITLYNIGIIYLLSEKPEYARKHYLENLKKYDFSGFYFGLGLCLYKEGEKAEAYNCYREGIIKGEIPELDILFNIKRKEQVWNLLASQYHFCKASAFYSMSNLIKALEELEFTIEINPDFSEAYKFLGKVYFEKGDFSSALKNYEAFLELEGRRDKYPGMAVEEDIALFVPSPRYFFVSPSRPRLAQRIEAGLNIMLRDGSLQEIFLRHHGQMIQSTRFCERRIFRLDNPFLGPETPLNKAEYWFDPWHAMPGQKPLCARVQKKPS